MFRKKLYKDVAIINKELDQVVMPEPCRSLLKALEDKDMYTYVHSWFTASYAELLARSINLADAVVKEIYIAGWMHDIGKIHIANEILQKPAKLTYDEYKSIQEHVNFGLTLLDNIILSDIALNAIKQHHERWDGLGYPSRIAGHNISVEARIIQIADTFSAVTTKRLYRQPLSFDDALTEIRQNSGTQFDPFLVDAFSEFVIQKQIAI